MVNVVWRRLALAGGERETSQQVPVSVVQPRLDLAGLAPAAHALMAAGRALDFSESGWGRCVSSPRPAPRRSRPRYPS